MSDKPEVLSDAKSMLSMIGALIIDPNADPDKVERMMGLQVQMQERENKDAFNAAMSDVQARCGAVIKSRDNNQTGSSYADIAGIIECITPIYTEAGFSLTFDTLKTELKAEDELIPMICDVSACGHTRMYRYDSPIPDKGIKGATIMTPAHAKGSAVTYGRRYLMCMIFNIATKDDDGNAATGNTIEYLAVEQILNVRKLLDEKGKKEGKLLEFYNKAAKVNIARIDDISASWYDRVVKLIAG